MIRKTVYFRTQDDLDKFNAIGNKAEWLHEHLNQVIIYSGEPPIITSVDNTTNYESIIIQEEKDLAIHDELDYIESEILAPPEDIA